MYIDKKWIFVCAIFAQHNRVVWVEMIDLQLREATAISLKNGMFSAKIQLQKTLWYILPFL